MADNVGVMQRAIAIVLATFVVVTAAAAGRKRGAKNAAKDDCPSFPVTTRTAQDSRRQRLRATSEKTSTTKMHELGISMARLSALPRRVSSATTSPTSEEYDKKTDLFHEGRNQGGKLVVIMVGLPGRGKSYMARKVARYLNWINYATRVFNIGNYRRKLLGADHSANFFDPDNPAGKKQRMEMAEAAMDDMLKYLNNEGEVAIYDGTNSTLERRLWIQERVSKSDGYHLLFIESICEDERIIERNIIDTKLRSPDYKATSPEEAVADFRARIAMYRKNYEALGEADEIFSYVKVIDAGTKLIMNRIHGYLPMKILSFISNLHIVPRPIYMTCHGESVNSVVQRLGGDSDLTPRGVAFSEALGNFVAHNVPKDMSLWYSTAKCARQTAQAISSEVRVQWRALRGLEAGLYNSLTKSEFQLNHPTEYQLRMENCLWYRYPLGESYMDVLSRLEPVIFELERCRTPVVIVAHVEVVRCLYAYFLDLPILDIPKVHAPFNEVIELHTTAYECLETRHVLLAPE
ncbi:hypothetical protein, variant 1 [Aphanomyces invadans]|uniref:6-phosphofructo-2-kinase domain-containing protein n=1 Tax=Aphanomyces invadans TaxID=157072 RepID=A0A024UIB2_9STRA|nr:hypothetical protein, variant 1 [Aphanomyces invadans]ETW05348.1 hypothetical protein, variant 1 [Aphanomyces invadans]|eukprot:XP_008866785.1 hypothetical protein, variant 1 [Aphanomyces invadans]